MAMLKLIYLFDVDKFRAVIKPVVMQLVQGNTHLLKQTASSVAEKNPHIWSMLVHHRMYSYELGREDEEGLDMDGQTNLWMMTILASFWQEFDFSVQHFSYSITLLRDAGWDECDVLNLLIGNSQRALLQPELVDDLVERPKNDDAWPFWCWFGPIPTCTGWLAFSDIQVFLPRVLALESKATIYEDDRIVLGYQILVKVLSIASERKQGLFTAISD